MNAPRRWLLVPLLAMVLGAPARALVDGVGRTEGPLPAPRPVLTAPLGPRPPAGAFPLGPRMRRPILFYDALPRQRPLAPRTSIGPRSRAAPL